MIIAKKRSRSSKRSKSRGRRKVKRSVRKVKRRARKPNKFHVALQKLKRMNGQQQRQALLMSNDAFIRQMCTQVRKLRHAHMPSSVKKRMQKQRKKLQKLVMAKTSTRAKRKMLTQRGGFLPLLIAALPAVGAMVGKIIAGTRRRRS